MKQFANFLGSLFGMVFGVFGGCAIGTGLICKLKDRK